MCGFFFSGENPDSQVDDVLVAEKLCLLFKAYRKFNCDRFSGGRFKTLHELILIGKKIV